MANIERYKNNLIEIEVPYSSSKEYEKLSQFRFSFLEDGTSNYAEKFENVVDVIDINKLFEIDNTFYDNEIDNDSIISTDNYQNNNKTNIKTISNISNPIVNIDDIIRIRVNNTFAKADKKKLKEFQEKLKVLNDYTFDQNIGYLVCQLLDAKFRVASEDSIVISYE